MQTTERFEAVVVGGGQAGLATGYELARRGVDFTILDAGPAIGHVWRSRWDSLRLFTPARWSSLPGMALPADPDCYPTKDEVADYLAAYAARFALPVRTSTAVSAIHGDGDGYALDIAAGTLLTHQVVVATGPFQRAVIPALGAGLHPAVTQIHSSGYRSPDQLPDGDVAVIGGGNSGFQIAHELAASRRVHLAVGERGRHVPQRILGRDLFTWLIRAGAFSVAADSRIGRRMQRQQLVIGTPEQALRDAGVTLRPRAVAARGHHIEFADGAAATVSAIVWATGYRTDHSLVRIPGALDGRGALRQHGGVTPASGLYTVGLPWQRTRGSALLGFVGADAASIAARIADSTRTAVRQPAAAA